MPVALWALAVGAFGIGTTEFVIMGLLPQVGASLDVTLSSAGLLVTGYALGVTVGAPPVAILTTHLPRKTLLLALMVIFIAGNLACALAPDYGWLMGARVLTSLAHGAFFGVGSVVATSLVRADKQASAIALMFTGLTLANVLGVPFGTWLGQAWGWRSTFWAVTAIGVAAFIAIAALVPASRGTHRGNLRGELRALARPQVMLGFLMTVLGFGGVFTAFTYISPLLTQLTGFPESAVSPILLLFGVGLVAGNTFGGRMADRRLMPTLVGSLAILAVVLVLFAFTVHDRILAVITVGVLGAAAFATVPPLQMRVLEQAGGAPNLASAFNIAAFNLGNAIGAWLGGLTIDHGPGLGSTPLVAAAVTASGLLVAILSWRLDRRNKTAPAMAAM
ncbi:transmembrane efflux protein of the MFS type [Bordetella ansorpii]|uniref:Transmembrane efflux protein of the MFS type n=1 Tax=Bordetella ansorpii TaxID=288768 RepID=A0A157SB58_9BORD|nr:MFS transporter [Bordetella ansorpii]SAI67667.1 transmembrane efflux protein of the MFS type [Bordetella ansorpii]